MPTLRWPHHFHWLHIRVQQILLSVREKNYREKQIHHFSHYEGSD